MSLGKDGLALSLLGLLILGSLFVLVFHGLVEPVQALLSMAKYLILGAITGFALLFVFIGLLMALS